MVASSRHGFACELEFLSGEARDELAAEAESKNVEQSQLVLQKGLLDTVQVEIVETLVHPNDVIPGYEILELLGQGGMGVVYRARQLNLDRIVALKTVSISRMADRSIVSRFEQEAMTIGKLRHPNIITAYDFGRHEGRLYLAMELIEGEDLDQLIKRSGRLNEATVWGLARQASAGLAHAAQLGIVHRDIKPANILLVEPPAGFAVPSGLPMVKIADFGLAFLTSELDTRTRLTSVNAAVGSPHYMSPEQYDGDSVDLRADIYSLGATIHQMLTGHPPFDGLPLTKIISSKITSECPSITEEYPEISSQSSKLTSELLRRDPSERPADYDDLMQRIDNILASLDPTETSVSLSNTTANFQRKVGPNQTVELTKDETLQLTKRSWSSRVLPIVILVSIAAVAGLAFMIWFSQNNSTTSQNEYKVGSRDLRPTGNVKPLYRGESLKGWPVNPISGPWGTADDPYGSRAIEGTNGVHGRSLAGWENYQLTAQVWPRESATAEIHFGLLKGANKRFVVRIAKDEIQVGRRNSASGEFQSLRPLRKIKLTTDDYSTVHIEKQRTDWFIFFGEKFIDALPVGESEYQDEFCIAAVDGTAWFHQIEVAELSVATSEKERKE